MSPTPDDTSEFLPLFPEEDEDTILARWQAWANEGLTTADVDEWVDVRPGSFWYITSMPGIREAAKLYDLMGSEFPAAAFPLWSWGTYLDDLATERGLARFAATFANGSVTFTGTNGTVIPAGSRVSTEGAVDGTPGQDFLTDADATVASGTATVTVTAGEAGSAGNVGATTIKIIQVPITGITAVNNAAATLGGTDTENDESLRERVIAVYQTQGAGTQADYARWAIEYGGVGRVYVLPLWAGAGTVKVVILGADGHTPDAGIVSGLQAFLDPTPGLGEGQAPIGATVTVEGATEIDVDVGATVELDNGYSLDGAGGTVDLSAALEEQIIAAIQAGKPGGEVVLRDVIGRIMRVTGVHDVGSVTLNGGTANIALDNDPAQVGALDALTLVEGAVP